VPIGNPGQASGRVASARMVGTVTETSLFKNLLGMSGRRKASVCPMPVGD
jgi:hypothetical protein